MKSEKEHALITAAFRKLIARSGIERTMDGNHSVAALLSQFQALPWDTSVFTLTGRDFDQWTVDVTKDGPTLTLTPADTDNQRRIVIGGSAFFRHLTAALEESHPGLHLEHDESLLARLFHDYVPSRPALMEMLRRHEAEALRAFRLDRRSAERHREAQWRSSRAREHQSQYAIWYQ